MTTAHRDQLAGLNPEEEAEKCRTERRKMNRRQTTAKSVTSSKMFRFAVASSAKKKCSQKHRLSTLLHSATEWRQDTSGSESTSTYPKATKH